MGNVGVLHVGGGGYGEKKVAGLASQWTLKAVGQEKGWWGLEKGEDFYEPKSGGTGGNLETTARKNRRTRTSAKSSEEGMREPEKYWNRSGEKIQGSE